MAGTVAAVVLLLVTAVVVGVLVVRGADRGDGSGPEGRPSVADQSEVAAVPDDAGMEREAAREFAEQAVLAVTATSADAYDEQVAAAVVLMTDTYAAVYRQAKDALRAETIRQGLTAEAVVRGTGTCGIDADRAEVLVFLEQHATRNEGEPTEDPQVVIVDLVSGDGGWLLDGFETDRGCGRWEPHPERSAAMAGARALGEVFLNLTHETVEEDHDAVLELATGTFARQYAESGDDLVAKMQEAESVQRTGRFRVGLEEFEGTSATVLLAAWGTVSNRATGGDPEPRLTRLRVRLALVDDQWLTEDLEYVT